MIRQMPQSMTARDAFRILFRYRWRGLLCFLGLIAIGVGGVLLVPKKYQSEATFYMKPDFRVDPTATNDSQVVAFDPEREAEMRSVVALLKSRILYEQVVDLLGTDVIFENDLKDAPLDTIINSITSLIPEVGPQSEAIDREKAVRQLMKSIKLEHEKKSHVVVAAYKSRSAERAQEVLTAFTDAAMQQHLEANRNPTSFEFFVSQESLLKQKSLEANEELRDMKNQYGLVSIGSQRTVLEEHMTNLDKELLSSETALAAAEDNIQSLRSQLPFEMQNPEAGSALSVHAVDTMRNQLFGLEIRYRDLLSRYQENHPLVVSTKDQLTEAKLVLHQQQLVNEISKAAALRSKLKALKHDRDTTKERLEKLNEHEVTLAQMERRAEDAAESHRQVVKKLEQARLDQQLGSEQISNLRLTQAPTLMGKSLSRQGLLIVAVSTLAGLFGAPTLAYGSHLLDETLVTSSDAEEALGVQVLASLPKTRRVAFP